MIYSFEDQKLCHELAIAACAFARSLIKYSSTDLAINKRDIPDFAERKKTHDDRDSIIQQSRKMSWGVSYSLVYNRIVYSEYLDVLNVLLAAKKSLGNCGEFATLALLYIAEYLARFETSQGKVDATAAEVEGHMFIIVGDPQSISNFRHISVHEIAEKMAKNPNNYNAFICDPWKPAVYHVSEMVNKIFGFRYDPSEATCNSIPFASLPSQCMLTSSIKSSEMLKHQAIKFPENPLNQIVLAAAKERIEETCRLASGYNNPEYSGTVTEIVQMLDIYIQKNYILGSFRDLVEYTVSLAKEKKLPDKAIKALQEFQKEYEALDYSYSPSGIFSTIEFPYQLADSKDDKSIISKSPYQSFFQFQPIRLEIETANRNRNGKAEKAVHSRCVLT